MLTLFTTPKPFLGHIGLIQSNALRSWAALGEGVRVIVFGEEDGTAGIGSELGLIHAPRVARNEYGTPLLNDMFTQAERLSDHRFFCYVNADILLMNDFAAALRTVAHQRRRFLMVGRRHDLDLTEPIDFTTDWEPAVRQRVAAGGKLQRPTAIDYFAYPRGVWGRLPAFAIGRTAWDNWMIFRARQLNVPVIDATGAVTCVHQNHDYAHTKQAPTAGRGHKWVWRGPEAKLNYAMAGGQRHLFTIWDATHVLTPDGLMRRPDEVGLGGGIWSYRRSAGF